MIFYLFCFIYLVISYKIFKGCKLIGIIPSLFASFLFGSAFTGINALTRQEEKRVDHSADIVSVKRQNGQYNFYQKVGADGGGIRPAGIDIEGTILFESDTPKVTWQEITLASSWWVVPSPNWDWIKKTERSVYHLHLPKATLEEFQK